TDRRGRGGFHERFYLVRCAPATGDGDGHGERLVNVGEMRDTDSPDLFFAEPDCGVEVEGYAPSLPLCGVVSPRGEQDAQHRQGWSPYASFSFDEVDVVFLFRFAGGDSGDGEGSGAGKEIFGVPLVGAGFCCDPHSVSSTPSSSSSYAQIGGSMTVGVGGCPGQCSSRVHVWYRSIALARCSRPSSMYSSLSVMVRARYGGLSSTAMMK